MDLACLCPWLVIWMKWNCMCQTEIQLGRSPLMARCTRWCSLCLNWREMTGSEHYKTCFQKFCTTHVHQCTHQRLHTCSNTCVYTQDPWVIQDPPPKTTEEPVQAHASFPCPCTDRDHHTVGPHNPHDGSLGETKSAHWHTHACNKHAPPVVIITKQPKQSS